jgi:pimeloyl-ACP methyl ester carboxylesterase
MNVLVVLCALAICHPALAIPAEPHFFQQRVDHFSVDDRTYQQRYYINDTSFAGAGSPIFMIMGGEAGIEPSTGIFYPSIVLLAQKLRGIVVEPEHRFYGSSQPLQPYSTQSLQLLTSAQALADAAALLTSLRQQLKCSGLNGEPRCPAVAIGGSYPGFLAAMMRIRYPNVVDMAYAASAPLRFYSQVCHSPMQPMSIVIASALMLMGYGRLWTSSSTTLSSLPVQSARCPVALLLCAMCWPPHSLLLLQRMKLSRIWACVSQCRCICSRAAWTLSSKKSI